MSAKDVLFNTIPRTVRYEFESGYSENCRGPLLTRIGYQRAYDLDPATSGDLFVHDCLDHIVGLANNGNFRMDCFSTYVEEACAIAMFACRRGSSARTIEYVADELLHFVDEQYDPIDRVPFKRSTRFDKEDLHTAINDQLYNSINTKKAYRVWSAMTLGYEYYMWRESQYWFDSATFYDIEQDLRSLWSKIADIDVGFDGLDLEINFETGYISWDISVIEVDDRYQEYLEDCEDYGDEPDPYEAWLVGVYGLKLKSDNRETEL